MRVLDSPISIPACKNGKYQTASRSSHDLCSVIIGTLQSLIDDLIRTEIESPRRKVAVVKRVLNGLVRNLKTNHIGVLSDQY